jgi:hypothetical protein
MRWLNSVFAIMIMAMIAGCGRDSYSSRTKDADFAAYKTYAWLPMEKDTTDGNVLDNEITYVNLREAANQEMKKRGYTLDTKNPDLLLMLRANFKEEREIVRNYVNSGFYFPGYYMNPWNPYYGGFYNYPYAFDYSVYNYVRGTVIIDAIDKEKNQLVWRGWTEERIDNYKELKKLHKEVEDIFEEYPVTVKGKVKK